MKPDDIYLATVGIEKFRWAKRKRSSVDLCTYIPRIAEAGFDGIELWEHHATELSEDDLARARDIAQAAGCPVTILSTYVETRPTDENVAHRRRLNDLARTLGVEAYKYNVGGPSLEEAMQFVRDWAAETDVLFLCECHPGSLAEKPEVASDMLRALMEDRAERFPAILHSLTAEDEEFETDLALKKDLFRHVHLQDTDKHRRRVAERVKRLKKMGLGLTWSIEFSSPVREGADNETCFRAAVEDMEFLQECLT